MIQRIMYTVHTCVVAEYQNYKLGALVDPHSHRSSFKYWLLNLCVIMIAKSSTNWSLFYTFYSRKKKNAHPLVFFTFYLKDFDAYCIIVNFVTC